ncbi:MAG: ABC transporter substrate-binding protein [Eubacteriales bacterium]|nr:ABC transporter substrate-binding protein [Eubacteriales bacterium]
MKKLLSLVLALALVLGMTSAMAETNIKFFGLKIEIDPALQEYANTYAEKTGVKVTVESLGGGADYGSVLKSKQQAGELPHIIQIEGEAGYNIWKDYIVTLDDAKFVERTELAYKDAEGHVVGFPVAIEGYGLAYNKAILEKAGIDPATLNSRANLEKAFATLEEKKAELGIDYVLSAAGSIAGGMWWSMGQHVWSSYFSAGLPFGDRTYIDMAKNEGKVDEARMHEFAEYVALLFKYANPDVLQNGDYNAQITPFAEQKVAFVLQGNWIDPNMAQLGADFEMGFAPHAFLSAEDNGIQLNPPSWYLVTNTGTQEEIQAAKDFLDSLVLTEEGQDFMVNKAGMVPAFSGIEAKPAGKLSLDLMEKNARGGNHSWHFGEQPDGFGMNIIGPIMDLYAQNPQEVDVDALAKDLTDAVAQMPELLKK